MSLKGDKYENVEEVKFRLEGTVVLYDSSPVYIRDVTFPEEGDPDNIARVHFNELPMDLTRPRPPRVRKFLSSRKFDLTPFKMGYLEMPDGATILTSRTANRQNRQGLCDNNTILNTIDDRLSRRARLGGIGIDWLDVISSPGFSDMVKGTYTDFQTSLDKLTDKRDSTVFSREFAAQRDEELDLLFLYRKGRKCGYSDTTSKSFRLAKSLKYLANELEEARIPLS